MTVGTEHEFCDTCAPESDRLSMIYRIPVNEKSEHQIGTSAQQQTITGPIPRCRRMYDLFFQSRKISAGGAGEIEEIIKRQRCWSLHTMTKVKLDLDEAQTVERSFTGMRPK
jgi:hypothetical protein